LPKRLFEKSAKAGIELPPAIFKTASKKMSQPNGAVGLAHFESQIWGYESAVFENSVLSRGRLPLGRGAADIGIGLLGGGGGGRASGGRGWRHIGGAAGQGSDGKQSGEGDDGIQFGFHLAYWLEMGVIC
jgi:hypothetical protein